MKDKEFVAFDTAWDGSYDNVKETLDALVHRMELNATRLVGAERDGYVSAMKDLIDHFESMNQARLSSTKRNRCLRNYLHMFRVTQ